MEDTAKADPALNTLWRNADDGRGILLRITAAGLDALGIEAGGAAWRPLRRGLTLRRPSGSTAAESAPQAAPTARSGKTREGTKQALLIGMLGRVEGATIDEIVAATGWQPHTVRGAFAGALKKRLGLTIKFEKVEGRGRVPRPRSTPTEANCGRLRSRGGLLVSTCWHAHVASASRELPRDVGAPMSFRSDLADVLRLHRTGLPS